MARIVKASISFISLVPKGANRMKVIYKSNDEKTEFQPLIKFNNELGELTAVVYAPEIEDSQGDIASAEVIKEMAYSFQKNGGKIDIRHDGKALSPDQAYIAESFIIQKGDNRFDAFKPIDVTGGWGVLIKIDDPQLRQLYRDGKWGGVSMFGDAKVQKEDDESLIARVFNGILNKFKKEPSDMDAKELKTALEENNTSLVKALTDGLKEVLVKKEEKKSTEESTETKTLEKPIFKGDPTKKEDLLKHQIALKQYETLSKIDLNDAKQLEEYIGSLSKDDQDDDSDPLADKESDDEEKRMLKERLRKLEKQSNQSPGEPDSKIHRLNKADRELAELGIKSAREVNKIMGHR